MVLILILFFLRLTLIPSFLVLSSERDDKTYNVAQKHRIKMTELFLQELSDLNIKLEKKQITEFPLIDEHFKEKL